MAVTANEVRTDKWPVAPHVLKLETSIIREILKFSSQPGVISFAGGLPAPELFPLEDLKQSMINVVDKYKAAAVQYSFSRGVPQLRELIAERACASGEKSEVDNIIVTSGGQQAIELIGRTFIEPGDYVLTESPTYVGALQAFNYYRPRYCSVAMDEQGMIVDQVEEMVKKYNPKLIYTVANFQNPTGVTMSRARRDALLEVAIRYNIPVVDDDPYGSIRFSGEPQPSLKALGGDAVIALSTFSKMIAPGMRIGWMNGPANMIPHFEKVKQGTDLHTSTLSQFMIHDFISAGKLEGHLETIKADYRKKCEIMLGALDKTFPAGITWTKPEGGLFLWVELPKHVSAKALFEKAIELKVAYVYGGPFFPNGGGDNTLRLNYSNATHEGIVDGIGRLATLFGDAM